MFTFSSYKPCHERKKKIFQNKMKSTTFSNEIKFKDWLSELYRNSKGIYERYSKGKFP